MDELVVKLPMFFTQKRESFFPGVFGPMRVGLLDEYETLFKEHLFCFVLVKKKDKDLDLTPSFTLPLRGGSLLSTLTVS